MTWQDVRRVRPEVRAVIPAHVGLREFLRVFSEFLLALAPGEIGVALGEADPGQLVHHGRPREGFRQEQHVRVGLLHLAIRVDDLQAWYQRLSAAGVEFRSPAPVPVSTGINAGASAVYLRDPDGFTIELVQPPLKQQ